MSYYKVEQLYHLFDDGISGYVASRTPVVSTKTRVGAALQAHLYCFHVSGEGCAVKRGSSVSSDTVRVSSLGYEPLYYLS